MPRVPSRLNEDTAQMPVAAFGYAAASNAPATGNSELRFFLEH